MKQECKTCGKEKEEKYKNNCYCRTCTIEKTKIWRANNPGYSKKEWEVSKKRQIKNQFCTVCKQIKEQKWAHTSYCSKCATERARKWGLENKEKVDASIEKRRLQKQSTTCLECSKIFFRKRGEKVCSISCKLLNEKIINEKGCWISPITGSRGYGQVSFRGMKNKLAHRVSYDTFIGPINKGMFVCHKCDTPACYNPEHLFLGTPKDNVHDGIKKGRIKHIGAKGSDCKFTNLTDEQIEEMRSLRNEGFSLERLSKIFRCQKEYISKITRNKVRIKNGLQQ